MGGDGTNMASDATFCTNYDIWHPSDNKLWSGRDRMDMASDATLTKNYGVKTGRDGHGVWCHSYRIFWRLTPLLQHILASDTTLTTNYGVRTRQEGTGWDGHGVWRHSDNKLWHLTPLLQQIMASDAMSVPSRPDAIICCKSGVRCNNLLSDAMSVPSCPILMP